jgi:hypothetical protein
MEVVLYTMFHLLERYGIDPEVTYLVDTRELYFVPVVNPDGYVYNQMTNPAGGGMWRKNRLNSGGRSVRRRPEPQLRLPVGLRQPGLEPDAELRHVPRSRAVLGAELSALRSFHAGRRITTAFHYHAYGGWEIHPFAYEANTYPPAADLTLFQRYGSDLVALNGHTLGNFFHTLGYLANGEAIDWSYGEQVEKNKVFAFLPEVGNNFDGFWPPASRIVPLCELQRPGNLYWAWIAGASGELLHATAGVTVAAGGTGNVVVQVENRGLGAATLDLRVAVSSSDPYVSIPVPAKAFPTLAPLALGQQRRGPRAVQRGAQRSHGPHDRVHGGLYQGPCCAAPASRRRPCSKSVPSRTPRGIPAHEGAAATAVLARLSCGTFLRWISARCATRYGGGSTLGLALCMLRAA